MVRTDHDTHRSPRLGYLLPCVHLRSGCAEYRETLNHHVTAILTTG